jgi:hypothetical protein
VVTLNDVKSLRRPDHGKGRAEHEEGVDESERGKGVRLPTLLSLSGEMKQDLRLLVFFLLLILVGCSVANMPAEEVVVSPATIIPSSTSLPTKTPFPTALPSLTPLPILSSDETFNQLFKSENTCEVPCWWGIIPGVSTWTETKQYIEQFSSLSFGVYQVEYDLHITKSTPAEVYGWGVWNPIPGTDYGVAVLLEVQNDIVTALEAQGELVWYFFPIDKLLEHYGPPDKVLIGIGEYDSNPPSFYARIYLLYEEQRILTSYGFSGSGTTSPLSICLYEYNTRSMFLWSLGSELNFDFSKLKPLEEFSELVPKTFYERFKDKENTCFELSMDAWK